MLTIVSSKSTKLTKCFRSLIAVSPTTLSSNSRNHVRTKTLAIQLDRGRISNRPIPWTNYIGDTSANCTDVAILVDHENRTSTFICDISNLSHTNGPFSGVKDKRARFGIDIEIHRFGNVTIPLDNVSTLSRNGRDQTRQSRFQ